MVHPSTRRFFQGYGICAKIDAFRPELWKILGIFIKKNYILILIKNLLVFFLPPYCSHLNKIETQWRKVKYEWLKVSDYASLDTLKKALDHIFTEFGKRYTIQFNTL
jgi:transposase